MSKSRQSLQLFRWAGFVVVCGFLLLALGAWFRWHGVWLARQLQDHLTTATDLEVAARMEQLAALDEAALPALVDSLHHERRTVRDAARRTLTAKLDVWRELPVSRSTTKVTRLAQLLAARANEASGEMLVASSELVLEILPWPADENTKYAAARTYACQQVLAAARRAGVLAKPEVSSDGVEVGLSPLAPATNELGTLGAPPPLSPPMPPAELPRGESSDSTGSLAAEEKDRNSRASMPRELPASSPTNLIGLSDVELIRNVADESQRKAAENELSRRGFSPLDVRVAQVVSNPDPAVRLQLANSLPQLAGVDTRSWLLLLLHDESPQVRAAAARWLATSGDPELHEHLRELAERETDESVRQALRSINAIKRQ